MKHIFFIDPIEKLVTKKDSTILLALTLKKRGIESYLLFEDDFYVSNNGELKYRVFDFSGDIEENFYVQNFKVLKEKNVVFDDETTIHMRIDPPYDSRYQRYLWMLDFLGQKGVSVKNHPLGIMKYNEKLAAYVREGSIPSYVGASVKNAIEFTKGLQTNSYIFKPLDLYQGIGVKKVENHDGLEKYIEETMKEYGGPIVIQPFVKEVEQGEIRSIFYKGKEIGTIIKVPKKGEFLANIARGAAYEATNLEDDVKKECIDICELMLKDGIDLVAFDILHGSISEVNITCPGLIVEVSSALNRNLCDDIINILEQN